MVVDEKSQTWRRPDIQGLRAVAVLLVVSFHAGLPVSGGFIGVDVFFVISGYVITLMLLRQHSSPEGFHFTAFYKRRMKRLLPALALMLAVVLVIAIFLEAPFGPQQNTAATAVGASLFVANFVISYTTGGYFDAPAELNPLLHTWSLSVEEQFYFIFPALLALTWSQRRRVLRPWPWVALLTAASLGLMLWVSSSPAGVNDTNSLLNFYSPFTRIWEFGAGALLALAIAHGWRIASNRGGSLLGLCGLALIALSAVLITPSTTFPGPSTLVPVLGALLVIAAGANPSKTSARVILSTPVLVFLGALSYSWYLWHWPAIVFTRSLTHGNELALLLAGMASLIPAWLSYRYVENPIRLATSESPFRLRAIIGLSIVVPIALALLLAAGAHLRWGNQALTTMAEQIEPIPISALRGCDSARALTPESSANCTWNKSDSGAPVYLVGDSQAGQFAEGMISATAALKRPLIISTAGSCPFITTKNDEPPLSDETCREFVASTISYLATQPESTVVIGVSGNYINPAVGEQFQSALERSVDTLAMSGHDVRILQVIPQFPQWSPLTCSLLQASIQESACGTSVPRQTMDDSQRQAITLFTDVARKTGFPAIDVRDNLCKESECASNTGNTWHYRDQFHISVGQSEELAENLKVALTNRKD